MVSEVAHHKITYELALFAAKSLLAHIGPLAYKIELVGSVRRKEPFVHDLDIVAIPKKEKRVVQSSTFKPANLLHKYLPPGQAVLPDREEVWVNILEERLYQLQLKKILKLDKNGPKQKDFIYFFDKAHQRTSELNYVHVNLWFCEWVNFGLISLLRTGPADYSKRFVTYLKYKTKYRSEKGFLINSETQERIPVRSEKELADKVGFLWTPPEERKNFVFPYGGKNP